MTIRARVFPLSALSLFWVLSHCTPEETIVAEVPSGEKACSEKRDCAEDAFCEKKACTQGGGICRKLPVFCPKEQHVVCGCDGVMYWNECLSQQHGTSVRNVGECLEQAARCGDPPGRSCPNSAAICAQLLRNPETCSTGAPGSCWVLPTSCEPERGGDDDPGGRRKPASGPDSVWGSCERPEVCMDLCSALKAGPAFPSPKNCRPANP